MTIWPGTRLRYLISPHLRTRFSMNFLRSFLLAGAFLVPAFSIFAASPLPNVVVIFIDDMGYADAGFEVVHHSDTACRKP